jgi:hypothetical protein
MNSDLACQCVAARQPSPPNRWSEPLQTTGTRCYLTKGLEGQHKLLVRIREDPCESVARLQESKLWPLMDTDETRKKTAARHERLVTRNDTRLLALRF